METDAMFIDCPEYMDKRGAVRCGLPAEVESRYIIRSTEGPILSAKIRCPRGHWFNGPVESFTWDKSKGETVPQAADVASQDTVPLPARHAWRP
ncbi:MAG TPA: hypothetical protein VEC76_06090 [Streptosporangiaceae bacterium]|nr:hypothetical protein [Streptosporangiaceae bacterium]